MTLFDKDTTNVVESFRQYEQQSKAHTISKQVVFVFSVCMRVVSSVGRSCAAVDLVTI